MLAEIVTLGHQHDLILAPLVALLFRIVYDHRSLDVYIIPRFQFLHFYFAIFY